MVKDKAARKARMGRNPRTGDEVKIAAKPASQTVKFRLAKAAKVGILPEVFDKPKKKKKTKDKKTKDTKKKDTKASVKKKDIKKTKTAKKKKTAKIKKKK